jgi:hypothetical protein
MTMPPTPSPSPSPARPRRGRHLAVLGIPLALALGLYLVWPPAQEDEAPPRAVPAGAPAGAPAARFFDVLRADEQAPAKATTIAFCNAGDATGEQQLLTESMLAQAQLAVQEKLIPLLAGSAVPRDQALAHYLSADARAGRAEQIYRKNSVDCDNDPSCQKDSRRAGLLAREEDLAALAKMAVGNGDADIYALAYSQCAAQPVEPRSATCTQLNAATWLKLAPDRLEPRIALAKEAWIKGEEGELQGALARVAQYAGAFEVRSPSEALAETAALNGLAENERQLAQMSILNQSQLYSLEALSSGYCTKEQVRNGGHRDLCQELAHKMIQPTSTLRHAVAGIAIGRNLEWSAERINQLRQEPKEMNKHLVRTFGVAGGTCASFHRLARLRSAILKYGELPAYRQFVAESRAAAVAAPARQVEAGN